MIRIASKKIFFATILFTSNIYSADLISIYSLAEKNDPVYLTELAYFRAALEKKPQALSRLLPSINLNARTILNERDFSSETSSSTNGKLNYNNRAYELRLNQALYRRDRFIMLDKADSEIQQAEIKLTKKQQELIVRSAERYFNVLSNIDQLKFSRDELNSLKKQLEKTKDSYEVGLVAMTDLTEAQAGYDLAKAREIKAQYDIDNAYENIRELTGEYIANFDRLNENMPLLIPSPEIIGEWLNIAMQNNMDILITKQDIKIAQKEIELYKSEHLPTLDLTASYGYNSDGGQFGITKTRYSTIGIEFNMPLYSGGISSSKIRQAYENYNAALQSLEQAKRSTVKTTREAYLDIISGINQIKALNKVIISSKAALEATKAGYEAGTRTVVDIVISERSASEAQKNYSEEKYNYILNILKLKQAAGILSFEDLRQINSWLTY